LRFHFAGCHLQLGLGGHQQPIAGVLDKYPDVLNVGKVLPAPVHDVEHHIRTSGPPIASKFRRLEGG
jgi:hypothetical protein